MSVYISANDREALSANMNRDMTIFDFYNDRAEYMRHISPSSPDTRKIIVLDCVNLYRASTPSMCHIELYKSLVSGVNTGEFNSLCNWLCVFISVLLEQPEFSETHTLIDAVIKLPTYYYSISDENPTPCGNVGSKDWYAKKDSSYRNMGGVCDNNASSYFHASFLTIKKYLSDNNLNATVRYSICIPKTVKTVYSNIPVVSVNESKKAKKDLKKIASKLKKKEMKEKAMEANSSSILSESGGIEITKDYDDLICAKKAIFYRRYDEKCYVLTCDGFSSNGLLSTRDTNDIYTLDEKYDDTNKEGMVYRILHINSISIDVIETMLDTSKDGYSETIHRPNTFWGMPTSVSFYQGLIQKPCVKFNCSDNGILGLLARTCSDRNFVKLGGKNRGEAISLLIYPKIVSNNAIIESYILWNNMTGDEKNSEIRRIRDTNIATSRVWMDILLNRININTHISKFSHEMRELYMGLSSKYANIIDNDSTSHVVSCVQSFQTIDEERVDGIFTDFN